MVGLRFAAVALVVCGAISPIAAQQKKPPKPAAAPKPPASPKQQNAAVKRLNQNPGKELDRFTNMSPEAREKELSKLPPQRRAAFEHNLARYEQMTPEQQERFKRQLEIMRRLPKDRQNAIRQEIEQLRALPPAERRKALNSDEFQQHFSPDEQELVRERFPGMKNVKPAPSPSSLPR
jgi:phage-related protein